MASVRNRWQRFPNVRPERPTPSRTFAGRFRCFPALAASGRRGSNPRPSAWEIVVHRTTANSESGLPDATRMRPRAVTQVLELARRRIFDVPRTMPKPSDLRREDAKACEPVNAPGRTRTCDPRLRRSQLFVSTGHVPRQRPDAMPTPSAAVIRLPFYPSIFRRANRTAA